MPLLARGFDSTLGFPGEGQDKSQAAWAKRWTGSDSEFLMSFSQLIPVMYSLAHTRCSRLSGFLRDAASICKQKHLLGEPPRKSKGPPTIWPMPVPWPGAFRSRTRSDWSQRGENLIVLTLNWLHLGCPGSVCDPSWILRESTELQQEHLSRLREQLQVWHGVKVECVDELGRAQDRFTSSACAIKRLEALSHEFDRFFQKYRDFKPIPSSDGRISRRIRDPLSRAVGQMSSPVETARPVIATRLKVSAAPSFNADPTLVGVHRQVMQNPFALKLKSNIPTPRVEVRTSESELVKLLERFDATDRLLLMPEGSAGLPRQSERVGLFTVFKDANFDRLIVDARPSNVGDQLLSKWVNHLTGQGVLCDLVLQPNSILYGYSSDIVDFYNRFQVTEARALRNVLCKTLCASKVAHLKSCPPCPADTRLCVGLRLLAMGDCQAVEIAQASHTTLAGASGAIRDAELISRARPFPRTKVCGGLCIDDFFVCEQEPVSEHPPSHCSGPSVAEEFLEDSEAYQRLQRLKRAYEFVGLQSHPEKEVVRASKFHVWGSEVDGVSGTYRAPVCKVLSLLNLTLSLVDLGYTSVALLESIVGMWSSVMQHNRRFYCLLDLAYEMPHRFPRTSVVRMSRRLKQELLTVCIVAPFIHTNLRAPFVNELVMTDASSSKIAGVHASVPASVVQELSRFALRKGAWVKLLTPVQAWLRQRDLGDDDPFDTLGVEHQSTPLFEEVAQCLKFRTSFVAPARPTEHINISELRAIGAAEARAESLYPGSRQLLGTDSQVAAAAIAKGRSSSPQLNQVLKGMLPGVIAGGVQTKVFWVSTSNNPADDPTRDKPLRDPRRCAPQWLIDLQQGEFFSLDKHLSDVFPPDRASDPSISDLLRDVTSEHGPEFVTRLMKACERTSSSGIEHTQLHADPGSNALFETSDLLEGPDGCAKADSIAQTLSEDRPQMSCVAPGDLRLAEAEELSSAASDILMRLPVSRFLKADGSYRNWRPKPGGVLCLGTGLREFAQSVIRSGAPWVVHFDMKDIHDPSASREIEELISSSSISCALLSPDCGTFSRAITPPVRSTAEPSGMQHMAPGMFRKVRKGNAENRFCHRVVSLCVKVGVRFILGNPQTSFFWFQRRFAKLLRKGLDFSKSGCFRFSSVDCCRVGTPYRKRMGFLTDLAVMPERLLCACKNKHLHLRGAGPGGKSLSDSFGHYPKGLQLLLAEVCSFSCGYSTMPAGWSPDASVRHRNASRGSRRKFDAICSDHNHAFAHAVWTFNLTTFVLLAILPVVAAPRPRRARRSLESFQTVRRVTPATTRRESESVSIFEGWLSDKGISCGIDALARDPWALDRLVVCFGEWLYSEDWPYYRLVYLITSLQKTHAWMRSRFAGSWDFCRVWIELEPPEHRRPVSSMLVRAIVSVALCLGWVRFAGVLFLMFHGGLRSIEPLVAMRLDLMFPCDGLYECPNRLYVKIGKPKTAGRGGARQQHASVTDAECIGLMQGVFRDLGCHERLWPGSPAMFRRRWDTICKILLLPTKFITPGGVRGGAACHMYFLNLDISTIMWRLRVSNQRTLSHYLQETAVESSLRQLPNRALERVRLFESVCSCLIAAVSADPR